MTERFNRKGESARKPFGGTPADNEFCIALHGAFVECGLLTHAMMGSPIDVDGNVVRRWLAGKARPPAKTFEKVVKLFDGHGIETTRLALLYQLRGTGKIKGTAESENQ